MRHLMTNVDLRLSCFFCLIFGPEQMVLNSHDFASELMIGYCAPIGLTFVG